MTSNISKKNELILLKIPKNLSPNLLSIVLREVIYILTTTNEKKYLLN